MLAGAGCLVLPAQVAADSGFSHVEGQARVLYDDNVRMRAGGSQGATVGIVQGSIELGRQRENARMGVALGGTVRRHAGASDLDSVSPYVEFLGSYDLQRGRLVVRSGYRRDSVIDSEEHASGLVRRRVDRYQAQAGISWQHRMSERFQWELAADLQEVDYRDEAVYGLHDYRLASVALDGEYAFAERTRLLTGIRQDDFAPGAGGLAAAATTLRLGVEMDVSRDWTLMFSAGVRHADVDAAPGVTGGSRLDFVPEASLVYQGRLNHFEVGVERGTRPTGAGELLDTRHGRLAWQRSLDPLWRFSLNLDAYRSTSLASGAVARGRDYLRSTAALRYRVTPEWELGSGYRFRYQKYDGSPLEARSHAVFVDVRYRGREAR